MKIHAPKIIMRKFNKKFLARRLITKNRYAKGHAKKKINNVLQKSSCENLINHQKSSCKRSKICLAKKINKVHQKSSRRRRRLIKKTRRM
jgi:hypothetical protein